MEKELWLEFGYLKDNDYQDVLWYNEGRWQDIWYFIKEIIRLKNKYKTGIYALWRFGRKNHYIFKIK